MGDKGRSPKLNKTAKIAKKTAKTLLPGHKETPKYPTRPFFTDRHPARYRADARGKGFFPLPDSNKTKNYNKLIVSFLQKNNSFWPSQVEKKLLW
jgi:hypothetical protein